MFKVAARLSETWVGEMKPGMSALGTLVLDSRTDAPIVARHAVVVDGTEYWLRGRSGAEHRIEPLSRNERFYLISEEQYARLKADGSDARPKVAGLEASP